MEKESCVPVDSREMGSEGPRHGQQAELQAGVGYTYLLPFGSLLLLNPEEQAQGSGLRTRAAGVLQPWVHQLPGTLCCLLSAAGARTNHWARLSSWWTLLIPSLGVSSGCGPSLILASGQGTGDEAADKSEVFQCQNGILSYFLSFYLCILQCTYGLCGVTLIPAAAGRYLKSRVQLTSSVH